MTPADKTCERGERRGVTGRGSSAPAGTAPPRATECPRTRALACRLNQNARSFDKAAENLARAAQLHLRGARLRQVVEAEEGKAVLAAPRRGN